MKRLLFVLALFAVAWTSSCGGGSSTVVTPPTGGFTNGSLTGTYVFSMTGSTFDTNVQTVDSFSRVGIFSADGKGGISTTVGVEDVHKFGLDNTFPITGGSYAVNADGRGTLSLITSGGTVQYSIALVSSTTGYMVDMISDDSETASGSFVLQTATTLSTGTYVFDFAGIDPASGNPLSIIGDFIPDGTGSFSSGSFEDINNGGNIFTKASIAGGSYVADNNNPGTGRGTAVIGNSNYVYYVIDSQHVELMDRDPDAVVGGTNLGEAVAQQAGTPTETSSFASSSFVFVTAGTGLQQLTPLARAGRLTASGANLSAILLDNNNAGVEIVGPLHQVTEEQYRRTFDINVWGVLTAMKYEVAAMLKTGGGAIINTSSIAGHIGMAQASIYAATKHAVEGLTKAVALEVAKQGIRVNAIAPGTIETDMADRFAPKESDARNWLISQHPVGRFGSSEEIAAAVLYLASDAAKFTTGVILPVDGGWSAA